jgi:hypothetical protein
MTPDKSFTERYLECRQLARQQAEIEFLEHHPDLIHLLFTANEYVAFCMLSLSGKNFLEIPHGLYASGLIISFTRTYFITIDLLGQGELIEAAVLTRKQMELLARLHEISANERINHLIRKTPNVGNLAPNFRRLYADYSEVAHSADPIHLQLLGTVEDASHVWTSVYPKYSSNASVTFNHVLLSVAEFHRWATYYLEAVMTEDEHSELVTRFVLFANEFVRVYASSESESLEAD